MKIKNWNKYNEGLFDKLKKAGGTKLPKVLAQYGYNSPDDFIRDVKKINKHSKTFTFTPIPETADIDNIINLYKVKNQYEEHFEIIDDLTNYFLELTDDGIQISYTYMTSHEAFDIRINPPRFDVETLYKIFEVLTETEGRGEIKFKIQSIESPTLGSTYFTGRGKSLRVIVYVNEKEEEPKGKVGKAINPHTFQTGNGEIEIARANAQGRMVRAETDAFGQRYGKDIQQVEDIYTRMENNQSLANDVVELGEGMLCEECEGTGIIDVELGIQDGQCPHCNGNGYIEFERDNDGDYYS